MSLNIKNPEAVELAAEVSRLTGESKTQAIITSLRQRLEREKKLQDREKLRKDLQVIAEKCAAYPTLDERSGDEMLYDERGLPL